MLVKKMLALGMVLLLIGAVAMSETPPKPPAPPNGGMAPTPPSAPGSAVAPLEQPVSPGTGMMVHADGDVNVRSGPGTSYSIIGTLGKGQTASCIGSTQSGGNGRVWYHINYYGGTGWVSSAYASVF